MTPRPTLYLASTSPRRSQLLDAAGIRYELVEPGPERGAGEPPEPLARARVRARAKCVGATIPAAAGRGLVLGVDTVVDVDGEELGKPADAAAARRFLAVLAGREHLVHTALCLRPHPADGGPLVERAATATVACSPLPAAAIDRYLATGEWRGKAGGYAIQGRAGAFMTLVAGELDTVVGLPRSVLAAMLADHAAARP